MRHKKKLKNQNNINQSNDLAVPMKTITKSFKFRIYPTDQQIDKIQQQFFLCNQLYNACIEQRVSNYKHVHPKRTSQYDQINELSDLKQKFPEYQSIHSQVLQNVVVRADNAFQNFFARIKKNKTNKSKTKAGFPRFKPYKEYKSFTLTQSGFKIIEKNQNNQNNKIKHKLKISKLGEIKMVMHRPIEGKIKNCIVKKTKTGKWFVIFVCECLPKRLLENDNIIAFDLNIKNYLTFSDGRKIENPRFLKAEARELAKAQKKLSKTEEKSKEREARRTVVARVHERISNKKEEFLQKESRKIVNENGVIICEKLNIKGMIESNVEKEHGSEYNKSIGEVSWGIFVKYVSDKAEEAGRDMEQVYPKNTSKMCSRCFNLRDMPLDVRAYECSRSECGNVMDRDHNAALNILRLGIQSHNKKLNSIENLIDC